MNIRAMATRAVVTTSAVAAAVMLAGTQSASASVDDSFAVATTGGKCGQVNFVDYGPGAPGGGNNDDYAVIHDYCSDGKGVRAYAWVDGKYLGAKNNTSGLKGNPVVWDPFGNVKSGSSVGLKVCLFNTSNTLSNCASYTKTRVDG
ncbi:hypothetical protein [Streptomyces montanisoli]|uniref:Secreted protein n=1 Tax=Streptomyces montanisoli TaxID=2798581 RepID=A0A940RXN5_9ACTN|nr:hypothetical protein [Streptomyces montanisoli]MBP0458333.1 hypothetical protein [Streptomyces montanisoli]